jgi:light-regulated signal transduction histidine kinase (bacteriophytochrome)
MTNMSEGAFDITRTIISSDFIQNNIFSLFPDSLFLDKDFNILGVSDNICTSLGYQREQLRNKSVAYLEPSGNFADMLRALLQKGYFNNELISIKKSNGNIAPYSISGFYLGMLTESNGSIILRCINREELEEMDRKLEQTKTHIDNFIYRTAHDLRGPLATMQGLVNLFKIRKDNTEVDRFVDLFESQGKKMDERLHQLMYLAAVNEQIHEPTFCLNISEMETALRKTIERNAFIDFLELIVTPHTPILYGYDEIQIQAMLTNVILYILTLPKCSTTSFIRITTTEDMSGLILTIKAEGFQADTEIRRNIHDINSSTYSDVLQSSKFTYLFAAQKIALPLKALISVDGINSSSEQLIISIPRSKTHT